MQATALAGWLAHPHGEALLRFMLLPTAWTHPRREGARNLFLGSARHASAAWLRAERLSPTLDLDEAQLRFALLPDDLLQHLQLHLGASLNARHIRRAITPRELGRLREQLGDAGMAAARSHLAQAASGLAAESRWNAQEARELCLSWGGGLLARAFDNASAGLRGRMLLRLLPEAASVRETLAASGLRPGQALDWSREFLELLEPQWLSSFPPSQT